MLQTVECYENSLKCILSVFAFAFDYCIFFNFIFVFFYATIIWRIKMYIMTVTVNIGQGSQWHTRRLSAGQERNTTHSQTISTYTGTAQWAAPECSWPQHWLWTVTPASASRPPQQESKGKDGDKSVAWWQSGKASDLTITRTQVRIPALPLHVTMEKLLTHNYVPVTNLYNLPLVEGWWGSTSKTLNVNFL